MGDNSRRAFATLVLIIASGLSCKKEAAQAPPPPPLTPADELEDAGENVTALCAVVKKHAGTPTATTAMERVKAHHTRGLAELPKRAIERKVEPQLAKYLEAVMRAASGKECHNTLGVSAVATIAIGPEVRTSSGKRFQELVEQSWPYDGMRLGDGIKPAIAELTSGWMQTVELFGSTPALGITFELKVVAEGRIGIGEGVADLPGLAMERTLVLRQPGVDAVRVALMRLDPGKQGAIMIQKGGDNEAEAEYQAVKELVSRLIGAIPHLPELVGLVPIGDPTLEAWRSSNFYVRKLQALENTCALPDPSFLGNFVGIDPMQRKLKISIYFEGDARQQGDKLIASEPASRDSCNQKSVRRLELARKGESLAGTFTQTWRNEGECDKQCIYRAEVVAE